ncbi:IS66-like element accessory protein TnpA [Roseovarius arcticus]|uniref:IS66-like element accessory protein TnpA n=1 Tax=Roseovarius arcticus TaxID=2547404 RepID=UPI001110D570|nr:transposase [Roseovarius arcticus]
MGGVKGQKKRRWSDDEKRSICEQTLTPGVSVAQVARRYSMNANLIFTWLRDPQFAPDRNTSAATEDTSDFLPIEIEGTAWSSEISNPPISPRPPKTGAAISAHRVDITLSDGRRILVEGSTELSAILGLMQGLMT